MDFLTQTLMLFNCQHDYVDLLLIQYYVTMDFSKMDLRNVVQLLAWLLVVNVILCHNELLNNGCEECGSIVGMVTCCQCHIMSQ